MNDIEQVSNDYGPLAANGYINRKIETSESDIGVGTLLQRQHTTACGLPSKETSTDIKLGTNNYTTKGRTMSPHSHNALSLSVSTSERDASDDDVASNITSVTLELRRAAKKTILHAKSKRAVHAMIPIEVKESMLEKDFPHIRVLGAQNKQQLGASRSANSMIAEHSVDSTKDAGHSSSSAGNSSSADQPSLDRVYDEQDCNSSVDYNDCVPTLSSKEMIELRSAMYSYEKQRVTNMMAHLSDQMQTFHELLEENAALKEEMSQVKKEKDNKISELENSIVEMKLSCAQYQSREDHHRLSLAKLEMDLKKSQEENLRLQQKLEITPGSDSKKNTKARRRESFNLTQSLSEETDNNVRSCQPPRRKNPLLTRSWFGKDSFLDRSFLREDSNNNNNNNGRQQGLGSSFIDRSYSRSRTAPLKSPGAEGETSNPPSPQPVIPARSRSFVEPKKAREAAIKDTSGFMGWNSSDKSDDEGVVPMRSNAKHIRSRSHSFFDPNQKSKIRGLQHGPIGSDVFLHPRLHSQHNSSNQDVDQDCEGDVSRSTFLSNITDITFEDGDTAAGGMEEDAQKAARYKESFLAKCCHPNVDDSMRQLSTVEGSLDGSHSTISEFQPAMPQLQRHLSLSGVQTSAPLEFQPAMPQLRRQLSLQSSPSDETTKIQSFLQKARSYREVNNHPQLAMPQLQRHLSLSGVQTSAPLEFQPAMPQLRRQLSLQSSPTDETTKIQSFLQKARSYREANNHPESPTQGSGSLQARSQQLRMAMKDPTGDMNIRPGIQKAASLRGRNKGKKSSAGDAYLAFC